MRISLSKCPSDTLGGILTLVKVSETDDPPAWNNSHYFRFSVDSSGGKVIVYSIRNVVTWFNQLTGKQIGCFEFNPEKCRNKEGPKEGPKKREPCNEKGCPFIATGKDRLLVTDVFHTNPTQNAVHEFGVALFKALFSGVAGELLKKIKPIHRDGRILLELNDDNDLDIIPWEYAKDRQTFLVHQRKFIRVRVCQRQHHPLQKLPLRIVAVVPDPVIPSNDPHANLPDLHLSDQWQKFIDGHKANSKKVILERVFPPTVSRTNDLIMNKPTVLHFMGHCVSKNTTIRVNTILLRSFFFMYPKTEICG